MKTQRVVTGAPLAVLEVTVVTIQMKNTEAGVQLLLAVSRVPYRALTAL
jgi:hypothetical protein